MDSPRLVDMRSSGSANIHVPNNENVGPTLADRIKGARRNCTKLNNPSASVSIHLDVPKPVSQEPTGADVRSSTPVKRQLQTTATELEATKRRRTSFQVPDVEQLGLLDRRDQSVEDVHGTTSSSDTLQTPELQTPELQTPEQSRESELDTIAVSSRGTQATAPASVGYATPPASTISDAAADVEDQLFVDKVKAVLQLQSKSKTVNVRRRQARRIHELLELAKPPSASEALYLSSAEAKAQLQAGTFFPGIIITVDQQSLPLQTPSQFLEEMYDDAAEVWIQDANARNTRESPQVRKVTVGKLKQRLFHPNTKDAAPWNCLELAAHVEDGLRPAFLAGEDCRLLTKLKHPGSDDKAARRNYEPGWKEGEKWALVAQAGALTEPHQDSHGYSTYITVNHGIVGFGWLANPSVAERAAWRARPASFTAGEWRYVVLRPGQTVFFPGGTVHFVFRLPSAGDTLAFGGHVLRCSQIVHWVRTMLEEKAVPNITNEDLSVSAPAYLERVERFVRQARVNGQVERWGGDQAIEEFLKLKRAFLSGPQKA